MEDGSLEAYFRGRKLKGKEVKLPEGYQGVIARSGGKEQDAMQRQFTDLSDSEDVDNRNVEETDILQEVGSFDEVIIWGHESLVEGDDAFVKGLGEWIGFAEAVRFRSPD